MDTGRLGLVRRRENGHRKNLYVLNGMIRTRWEILDDHLSKEKFDSSVKFEKSAVVMRRAIVRQRVLQQCMRMRRDGIQKQRSERMLGYYGGKPIHAFSRDIDKSIADMHPRLRRLRKVEKQIYDSLEKGKILREDEIPKRVKAYFEKHWKQEREKTMAMRKTEEDDEEGIQKNDIFKKHRNQIPPIRGLVNPFYKFVKDDKASEMGSVDDDIPFDRLVINREADEMPGIKTKSTAPVSEQKQIKDETAKSKMSSPPPLEKKRSLILPPIKLTKDLVRKETHR